jgi:two-component system chemotaxis response regulator CheY
MAVRKFTRYSGSLALGSPVDIRMTRVLIVDDSPTIRRMVKASLAPLPGPLDFIEAASGLEAIERLALGTVDLIVLDLNMPDMHGLEVLGFLRSHQKYRAVPVIVLTTRGDASSREAALKSGASSYLTKPFQPGVLAAEAGQLLSSVPTRGATP